MKIWTIILPLFILSFLSCRNEQSDNGITQQTNTEKYSPEKEVDTKIKDSVIFQSGSNGLADIRLMIIPNGNFVFHMRTIPQPMTEDEEAIINSSGTWTKKDNWVALKFIKDKPILKAVFDSNYADSNVFKVIDESTVNINIGLKQLYIWGVGCDKIKD
ncbi:hypothetical protein [Owenweeksia hongkongensis]|uniref:hypothetical protein n=1 Tax=Owenweeksia hongkongensis TaxID=253245 RepID=UPI003A932F62